MAASVSSRVESPTEAFRGHVHRLMESRLPNGGNKIDVTANGRLPESNFLFLAKLFSLERATAYRVYREVLAESDGEPYHTELPMQSAYRAAKQLEKQGFIRADGRENHNNGVTKQFYVVTSDGQDVIRHEAMRHFHLGVLAFREPHQDSIDDKDDR